MRQVSCNTGSVDNIVEGELVNEGGELEEEGQRLMVGGRMLALCDSGIASSTVVVLDVNRLEAWMPYLSNATRGTSDD